MSHSTANTQLQSYTYPNLWINVQLLSGLDVITYLYESYQVGAGLKT